MNARPFLKWVGGKTQLLDPILDALPESIEHYFEPFIGGGAVFFELANQRRFKRATISDANGELIGAYRVVRDRVDELILALLSLHVSRATEEEYYYAVRALDPTKLSEIERAARFIFLNKTCFRGLYRVNKAGRFNVPFGNYVTPNVCDSATLHAASEALQGVEIIRHDFRVIASRAKRGDAVYFDPPYVPASATSSFTAYTEGGFSHLDQSALLQTFMWCTMAGATAVISNSDTPATREIYEGLDVRTVIAARAINPSKKTRDVASELIVVGHAVTRPPVPPERAIAMRMSSVLVGSGYGGEDDGAPTQLEEQAIAEQSASAE